MSEVDQWIEFGRAIWSNPIFTNVAAILLAPFVVTTTRSFAKLLQSIPFKPIRDFLSTVNKVFTIIIVFLSPLIFFISLIVTLFLYLEFIALDQPIGWNFIFSLVIAFLYLSIIVQNLYEYSRIQTVKMEERILMRMRESQLDALLYAQTSTEVQVDAMIRLMNQENPITVYADVKTRMEKAQEEAAQKLSTQDNLTTTD